MPNRARPAPLGAIGNACAQGRQTVHRNDNVSRSQRGRREVADPETETVREARSHQDTPSFL
jgi:hypothetical protein